MTGRSSDQIWKKLMGMLLLGNLALLSGCTNHQAGADQMPYKGITQTIQEAKGTDDPVLDTLAGAIVERAYKETNELLPLTQVDVTATRQKAVATLRRLGPLPLTPLLDSMATQSPDYFARDMRLALELHLQSRDRLVAMLEEMLKDTRLQTPTNPFRSRGERAPTRRVCDTAYLLLRQLLALDESEDERLQNEDTYLGMDDAERDAEIKRCLQTKRWINLSQPDSEG